MRAKPRSKKQSKKRSSNTWWIVGIGGLVVLAVVFIIIALVAGQTGTPADAALMGDPVPITSRAHVNEGTNPGPYNSNPPAGGQHFSVNFTARFYQESDLAGLPKFPEGYLVHSLEHGYVIFWYNCKSPGAGDCAALKQQIQSVMNQTGGTKLIAFPWATLDVPLAMSSWGRVMKFPTIDTAVMAKFVQTNRYKAPEPDAN